MKQTPFLAIVMMITTLAVAGLACSGGRIEPTATPVLPTRITVPTRTPVPEATREPTQVSGGIIAGEIAVLSTYGYKDEFGYFHIVGEIYNSTEKVAENIELTVELKDDSGNTLLKDDSDNPTESLTFSPFLFTVAQGESSPFDFYIDVGEATPDSYRVTVTGQQTGQAQRASLELQNDQMVRDDSGNLYITGELVNLSDSPVQIDSLAGAALDENDRVVAANAYGPVTRILASAGDENENDRTPFRIRLDDPGDVASQWSVYWDADEVDSVTTYSIEMSPQNNYYDRWGSLHLVGLVTNQSEEILSIAMVAGVYAEDGTVVDADTLTVPFNLGPGESIPYNFEYFSNVNSNVAEANKLARSTVQVDPYWTSTAFSEVVALEAANVEQADEGEGSWTMTGEVTNTSDKPLAYYTVVIGVYEGDNLVASAYTTEYPEADLAPGASLPFDLTLYLDPETEGASGFEFRAFVQGVVQ
jgi:hypothetical protein